MNPIEKALMNEIQTRYPELQLYRYRQNLIRATSTAYITIHFSTRSGISFNIFPLSAPPVEKAELAEAMARREYSLPLYYGEMFFDVFQLEFGLKRMFDGLVMDKPTLDSPYVQEWIKKQVRGFYLVLYPILRNVVDAPSAFNALFGLEFIRHSRRRLVPVQSEYLLNEGYPSRAAWFARSLSTWSMYYFALECRYYDFLIEFMRQRLPQPDTRTPTSMSHDPTRPLSERLKEFRTNMQALHNDAEPERLPDSDGSFDSKNRQLIYALLSDKVFPELESSIVTSSSYRDFPPPPRNPELLAELLEHFEAHDDAYVQALIDENRPANVELINSILPKRLHIQ